MIRKRSIKIGLVLTYFDYSNNNIKLIMTDLTIMAKNKLEGDCITRNNSPNHNWWNGHNNTAGACCKTEHFCMMS